MIDLDEIINYAFFFIYIYNITRILSWNMLLTTYQSIYISIQAQEKNVWAHKLPACSETCVK